VKYNDNQWVPDILGDGFEQKTIQMQSDREGDVFCTLVRAVDIRQYERNVLYIHGFSDYFFQTELATRFRDNGFNFYALDLRKCGRSIRPWQTPSNLYSINDYYDDFDAAIDIIRTETNGSLTLLGHSTGGLALSVYLQDRPSDWADALILNSPFFELNIKESHKKRGLPFVMFLGKYCPYLKISKGLSPNYGNSISQRKFGEWDFNETWKPLAVSKINLSWLRAICMAQTVLQSGLDIRCPVLVMRSDKSFKSKIWSEQFRKADAVLNVEHISKYASGLGKNVTEIVIKDGLHDLILSALEVRTEVYNRMFEWLANQNLDTKYADSVRGNRDSIRKRGLAHRYDYERKDTITDFDLQFLLEAYADENSGDFNGTFNGISIKKGYGKDKDSGGYMAAVREIEGNRRKNDKNFIEVRDYDFKISKGLKFNPAKELKSAIQNIRNRKPLTFNEEYAIENLWHEILHCKANGWWDYNLANDSTKAAMETINQFIARNTYDDFLHRLGGKAAHKNKIIKNGYGYENYLNNFYEILRNYNISRNDTFTFFKDKILTSKYEDIEKILVNYLKENEVENAEKLVKNLSN